MIKYMLIQNAIHHAVHNTCRVDYAINGWIAFLSIHFLAVSWYNGGLYMMEKGGNFPNSVVYD